MSDREWLDFKRRTRNRQDREQEFREDMEDIFYVASGVIMGLLLCGFCFIAA